MRSVFDFQAWRSLALWVTGCEGVTWFSPHGKNCKRAHRVPFGEARPAHLGADGRGGTKPRAMFLKETSRPSVLHWRITGLLS